MGFMKRNTIFEYFNLISTKKVKFRKIQGGRIFFDKIRRFVEKISKVHKNCSARLQSKFYLLPFKFM